MSKFALGATCQQRYPPRRQWVRNMLSHLWRHEMCGKGNGTCGPLPISVAHTDTSAPSVIFNTSRM